MVEYTVPLLIRHKQNGRRPLSDECTDVKKKKKKEKKKEHASEESVKNRTHVLSTAFWRELLCVTRHAESIDQSQLETNSWLNRFIDKYEKYKKSFLVFNLAAIVRSWVKNQGTTFKVYAWHACSSMSRKYRWIGALRKQQLLCLVSKKKNPDSVYWIRNDFQFLASWGRNASGIFSVCEDWMMDFLSLSLGKFLDLASILKSFLTWRLNYIVSR